MAICNTRAVLAMLTLIRDRAIGNPEEVIDLPWLRQLGTDEVAD